MRATVLDEPDLEFAHGFTGIDPRVGVRDYGPADFGTRLSPDRIRIGIVGPPSEVPALVDWLGRCRRAIAEKESRYPRLFPDFPGIRPDAGYRCGLVIEDSLLRPLSPRALDAALAEPGDAAIYETVALYRKEIDALAEAGTADVVMCIRPDALSSDATANDDCADDDVGESNGAHGGGGGWRDPPNFHDVLKAKAMASGLPLQIIRPATYTDETGNARSLQDEATRAWNLMTALYYKAGGVPWRMVRDPSAFDSLYVGVSFFRTLDREDLHTAVAQVFNQRGDGVIVRGGQASRKNGRHPYLDRDTAAELLRGALDRYRDEHGNLPARVVLHKTSRFVDDEQAGFEQAAADHQLHMIHLVWVFGRPDVSLFRKGNLPPMRGTALQTADDEVVLYTRGTVPSYGTYPGMYVPRPIALRPVTPKVRPVELAREVMALSKMNWNQTQLDGRLPITLRTSRAVGKILRHLPADAFHQGRYAYYM